MATDPTSLRETIARTYPFQPAGVYEALERAVLEWLREHHPEKVQDNPPVCAKCGQWWPCDVVAPPVEGDNDGN
jgi:hypothetical protein